MSEERRKGGRPSAGEPLINRIFRLLSEFNSAEPALSAGELSRRTGIPLSTTFRLAHRLVDQGALERLPDGTFSIGLRMLSFAALAPRGHGLRGVALPYMEDLHRATRQHVQFTVREQGDGVMVERLSAPGASKALYQPGSRFPLHGAGSGLVILAHARDEFIESYLAEPLQPKPDGSEVAVQELREQLGRIREAGIANIVRELPEPTELIAAPVFDRNGECIASISVLGAVGSVDMRTATPAVVAIARAVSRDVARSRITHAL